MRTPIALAAAAAVLAGLLAPATAATALVPAGATAPAAAPKGEVSAVVLLGKLHVAKESHAGSYRRSRFTLWIDANGDGESTRAEVLKAESTRKVVENRHHTVLRGRWVSPYDRVVVTKASALDIDHVVPLEEAWTSGAAAWSAKRREAYANDLGYAPSLVAVTAHANRSKGDQEPDQWMPAAAADACTYVKSWIGIKSRWHLTIDGAEKTFLGDELSSACTNVWVKRPHTPNLKALLPRATHHSGGSGHSGGGTSAQRGVHPGAYCSPDGATGYTTAGTKMRCTTTATDSRDRWRRA